MGSEDAVMHTLFADSFAALGRLDNVTLVMVFHPQYLESFLKTQHYLLQMDGPLPLHYRHYIGIMVCWGRSSPSGGPWACLVAVNAPGLQILVGRAFQQEQRRSVCFTNCFIRPCFLALVEKRRGEKVCSKTRQLFIVSFLASQKVGLCVPCQTYLPPTRSVPSSVSEGLIAKQVLCQQWLTPSFLVCQVNDLCLLEFNSSLGLCCSLLGKVSLFEQMILALCFAKKLPLVSLAVCILKPPFAFAGGG